MNILKCISSGIFSIILNIRHWLFDVGFFKIESFPIPIVGIGNLKVGGTGKTPMTDFIISSFKSNYKIAVLSRGYKRKTNGFVLADSNATSDNIGDEAMLIHLRHPDILVAVCEKRTVGVKKIMELDPSISLILLDDAFQHRYIDTTIDILLTEFNSPYHKDYLLPRGMLRDKREQAKRASCIVITKCPSEVKPIEQRLIYKELNLLPYQSIYFTRMEESPFFPLFDRGYEESIKTILKGDKVILMTAIADPSHLRDSISNRYNLIKEFNYSDHHNFSVKNLNNAIKVAVENNAYIVVTEKDAVKIYAMNIDSKDKYRFFVAPISIKFFDSKNEDTSNYFINNVVKCLNSKNGKYYIRNRRYNE